MTSAPSSHFVEIAHRQLYNYCCDPLLQVRTFYVLPAPPYAPAAVDTSIPPAVSRARYAGHKWGGQPFEKWAFVVSAVRLWNRLFGAHPLPTGEPTLGKKDPLPHPLTGYTTIGCKTFPRRGRYAWPTLRRFTDDIYSCRYGALWGGIDEIVERRDDVFISDQAVAAFVPRDDLASRR
jgi:hypothetical protein